MPARFVRLRRCVRAVLHWTAPLLFVTTGLAWASTAWRDSRAAVFVPRSTPAGVSWAQYTITASQQTFRFAHYRGMPDPDDPGGWPSAGFSSAPRPVLPGWIIAGPPSLIEPTFSWTTDEQVAVVPCWMMVTLFGVPTCVQAIVWVRRRFRHQAGCCSKCGYSLSGLPEMSPCPECGRAMAVK